MYYFKLIILSCTILFLPCDKLYAGNTKKAVVFIAAGGVGFFVLKRCATPRDLQRHNDDVIRDFNGNVDHVLQRLQEQDNAAQQAVNVAVGLVEGVDTAASELGQNIENTAASINQKIDSLDAHLRAKHEADEKTKIEKHQRALSQIQADMQRKQELLGRVQSMSRDEQRTLAASKALGRQLQIKLDCERMKNEGARVIGKEANESAIAYFGRMNDELLKTR